MYSLNVPQRILYQTKDLRLEMLERKLRGDLSMNNETDTNELDYWLTRLAEISVLQLGRGPMHSTQPNSKVASEIEDFLSRYPVLRQGQGFVDFWQRYAGASWDRPRDEFLGSVYGFDPVTMHIENDEGGFEVIEQGLLYFADVYLLTEADHDSEWKQCFFGFEATGERPSGIYRMWDDNNETRIEWFCASFIDWLRLIVNLNGHWR